MLHILQQNFTKIFSVKTGLVRRQGKQRKSVKKSKEEQQKIKNRKKRKKCFKNT